MSASKSNFEGTIEVTLTGDATVNTVARLGDFVGLYLKGGSSGDKVPFLIQGCIRSAPKVGSEAWAVADALYWDEGNSRFTKVVKNASPDAVAASIVGSGAGETTGDIILLGNGKSFAATALTAQLTTITHTAPGTPDYAIQNLTQTTPFGFVTADEGNSVLKVVANLQTRLAQVEALLQAAGLVS